MNTKSLWELKILVIIASLYAITACQTILFPILFSFFLYLLLSPVMEWLVAFKIPKLIASSMISILLLGIISLGITFLSQPASSWIEHAPENFHIIESKFKFIKTSLGEIDKAVASAQSSVTVLNKKEIKVATPNPSLGPSIFNLTSNIIFSIGTILILLFFYLLYFKSLIQNLDKILKRKQSSLSENAFILSLKNEVSKYIFTFSIICIAFGSVMALIFWLLKVPNAALWGVMIMLLTFIPYLGHLIGIIIVFFVSLITFETYIQILTPPTLYFLCSVLEGQFITPIFLGKRLNLNPLLVFLNIFFWGWLWGVKGALISMPLLLTVKITLEHIPLLSKYTLLFEK